MATVLFKTVTMKVAASLLILFALALPALLTLAADEYRLQDGGRVVVDPDTKRATVIKDGVSAPMYDGTHRAEDGSILIIRQGVTTIPYEAPAPPREPKEGPAELWEGAPIVGLSPCERLVQKVCGRQDQCAGIEGCALARQLLDMEKEERNASGNRNRMTYTSGQCAEMTPDTELFPACE